MRQMWIENLLVFVVVNGSPVLLPTEKPENETAPALALLVISRMHDPSLDGAVIWNAPPFVMNWRGRDPQSIVMFPVDWDCDVTLAPPLSVWSASASCAIVLLHPVPVPFV
jgi:hypothetical protein